MQVQVNDNKILRTFAPKVEREEVFHSSGYAVAEQGATMGAGSEGIDMAKRRAMDEQRQFIKGYSDAKLMSNLGVAQRRMVVAEQRARVMGGGGVIRGGSGGSVGVVGGYAAGSGTGGSVSTSGARAGYNNRGARGAGVVRTPGGGYRTAPVSTPGNTAGRFQVKPSMKPKW